MVGSGICISAAGHSCQSEVGLLQAEWQLWHQDQASLNSSSAEQAQLVCHRYTAFCRAADAVPAGGFSMCLLGAPW